MLRIFPVRIFALCIFSGSGIAGIIAGTAAFRTESGSLIIFTLLQRLHGDRFKCGKAYSRMTGHFRGEKNSPAHDTFFSAENRSIQLHRHRALCFFRASCSEGDLLHQFLLRDRGYFFPVAGITIFRSLLLRLCSGLSGLSAGLPCLCPGLFHRLALSGISTPLRRLMRTSRNEPGARQQNQRNQGWHKNQTYDFSFSFSHSRPFPLTSPGVSALQYLRYGSIIQFCAVTLLHRNPRGEKSERILSDEINEIHSASARASSPDSTGCRKYKQNYT